jgi:hypothetical protein
MKILITYTTLGLSLGLAACQGQPTPMDPARLLARASLDLRGVRPSEAELSQVEADPQKVDELIDGYIQDPRLSQRVISLFSDIYRTRLDAFQVFAEDFGLDDELSFVRSVGEEPLQMLAYLVENDLPYSEIASGDFTMSNEVLGSIWPVDYPEGASGWLPAHYTDGRPQSGIMTMNSMWWRYGSTFDNANRGRANAVSRILLCQDYLSKPIQFKRDINLSDPEATSNAIRTNEGCLGCHSTLEPMATVFWGFYQARPFDPIEASFYHPEREPFYLFTNQVQPAYYGEPISNIKELGGKIAADPRLIECATQQVFEGLLARPSTFEDTASLGLHREAFVDNGTKLRSLFRSIVDTEEYRNDDTDDPRFTTRKMISVDLLSSQIEDLTGYRFTSSGVDMLRTSSFGLRTLAGGADGLFTTRSSTEPTVTLALVLERLSEMASSFVVAQDAQNKTNARLFTEIDFTETPNTNQPPMIAQLQKLRLRVLSQKVGAKSDEIKDDISLWRSLYTASGDTKVAWAGVLSALLQDPEFLFY